MTETPLPTADDRRLGPALAGTAGWLPTCAALAFLLLPAAGS